MNTVFSLLLFYLPLAVATGTCLYQFGVFIAALRFRREPEPAGEYSPAVTVLKPISGIEPHFYESLKSYFQQDYPGFEIIFGLRDPADPAHWTITQLQQEFPAVPVKVVFVADPIGVNPKTFKLRAMLQEASHEVLVISDADIRVERDYLRSVVRPLQDERTGLVTCLYRGVRAGGLNSLLEALSMAGDFAGQVLLGRMVGGMRFGLGATLATRKKQIAAIGGLAPWIEYLADDFVLGDRIAKAGFRVHLSHTVVETLLPRRSWKQSLRQQLRWARTIRACSPHGYLGLVFAFGAPVAALPVAMNPDSLPALYLFDAVLIFRWLAAWAAGVMVCRDRVVRNYFWLLPLRDLYALLIWMLSFLGNQIVWRQTRYRLEPNGKIRPV